MNTTLNINRLGLLLKRYFAENKQRELTFWGITTFVFMIIHSESSTEMFIYISGIIFAARTFKIFNNTPSSMHYLLIPATHKEKLSVNVLLSVFYYFTMILITYTIGTIIATFLGNMMFGYKPLIFDFFSNQWNNHGIFSGDFFDIFTTFTLLQSVFMLGSIYFKGNVAGKTVLAIFGILIILGLIELFLLRVTFGTFDLNGQMLNLTISPDQNMFPDFEIAGKIFKYALIPFFWVVTYFRLTEKEV